MYLDLCPFAFWILLLGSLLLIRLEEFEAAIEGGTRLGGGDDRHGVVAITVAGEIGKTSPVGMSDGLSRARTIGGAALPIIARHPGSGGNVRVMHRDANGVPTLVGESK